MSITDSNENKITLTRSPSSQLTQITDPVGRTLTLTYDSPGRTGRITSVTDPIGRSVQYTYTSAGFLQTVTDVNKGVTTYGYDVNNNLKTIADPRQITVL